MKILKLVTTFVAGLCLVVLVPGCRGYNNIPFEPTSAPVGGR